MSRPWFGGGSELTPRRSSPRCRAGRSSAPAQPVAPRSRHEEPPPASKAVGVPLSVRGGHATYAHGYCLLVEPLNCDLLDACHRLPWKGRTPPETTRDTWDWTGPL